MFPLISVTPWSILELKKKTSPSGWAKKDKKKQSKKKHTHTQKKHPSPRLAPAQSFFSGSSLGKELGRTFLLSLHSPDLQARSRPGLGFGEPGELRTEGGSPRCSDPLSSFFVFFSLFFKYKTEAAGVLGFLC